MVTQNLRIEPKPNLGFIKFRRTDGSWQSFELGSVFTIGRAGDCVLSISDEFVSARHARIEKLSHGFVLRDLRSRNGTYLNGALVMEAVLSDLDRVRVGKTELLFQVERESDTHKLLTSKNAKWHEQLQKVAGIGQSELPVLIQGPSGTGKEMLAQALHLHSPRRQGPLVSVNCSALSESLVESELFGHVKGSFTGATNDRKGAFKAAHGGTLFLDEVGDLPLSLQPKLLRALENNEIKPVGSDRPMKTDVRIVAATHQNLAQKITEGQFRGDLFYRLNVTRIATPSLADRIEDFESLLFHFAKQNKVKFEVAAIERLKEHSWPGNIRELKNTVARARAYFTGESIDAEKVEMLLDGVSKAEPLPTGPEAQGGSSVIAEIEKRLIMSSLEANNGNQRKTAFELGLPKSTLHDRIRKYGLDLSKLARK